MCQRIPELIEVGIRQADKPYADQKVGCHDDDRCEQPQVAAGGEGQNDKDSRKPLQSSSRLAFQRKFSRCPAASFACRGEEAGNPSSAVPLAPSVCMLLTLMPSRTSSSTTQRVCSLSGSRKYSLRCIGNSKIIILNKVLSMSPAGFGTVLRMRPSYLFSYSSYSPVGNPVCLMFFRWEITAANSLSVVDT